MSYDLRAGRTAPGGARPGSEILGEKRRPATLPVHVLLVEDDPAHAELVRSGLESRRRFEITEARSLAEARSLLGRVKPDVALVDLVLPDGSGVEILSGEPGALAFPVVIMTSHGDETAAVEAIKSGALDYLVKSETSFATMAVTIDRALREWRHIREKQRAERALVASEHRFRALYEENPSMFFTLDRDGTIVSVNQFGAERIGFRPDELIGLELAELYTADRVAAGEEIRACFEKRGGVHRWEACQRHRDGSEVWVRTSARVVHDESGAPMVLAVGEDITEAKRLSEKLSHEESHDSLTGLLNRREFERRLVRVLETARSQELRCALCYLDLDQFKVINDTLGPKAGDEMLRQVAALLERQVRKMDFVARLGGDEFGVLVHHCSLEDAVRVAENLSEAIESHAFLWQGREIRTGVSLAVVPIDRTSESMEAILKAADATCYAAKEGGRSRIRVWHAQDDQLVERQGQMLWVSRIRSALQEDRFTLFQQPIADLSGKAGGAHFEVLVRLRESDGTLLPPGAFLAAAERYYLAERLDRWVVGATLRWLAGEESRLHGLRLCAVNLSGQSLSSEATLGFIVQHLRSTGVPPQKICFEITETAAVGDVAAAVRFIGTLRDLGCHFALDDFGTGLSSFGYLKTLPVDYLKIDGMFVREICEDPFNELVVRSIHEIGRSLGKRTIAEFVESEEVLERVREIGVDFAQGFHLGRPQPLDRSVLPADLPQSG